MQVRARHSANGTLVIEIDGQCNKCQFTHPTEQAQWDEIIRQTCGWLAENSPVCRDFPGILPWARGESPSTKLTLWDRPPSSEGPSSAGGHAAAAHYSPSDVSRDTGSGGSTPGGIPQPPPVHVTSALVMRQAKPIRSVFGCTMCKKRKVKCDEKRPKCSNCAKKSQRECVYLYEVATWTEPQERPATVPETSELVTPTAPSAYKTGPPVAGPWLTGPPPPTFQPVVSAAVHSVVAGGTGLASNAFGPIIQPVTVARANRPTRPPLQLPTNNVPPNPINFGFGERAWGMPATNGPFSLDSAGSNGPQSAQSDGMQLPLNQVPVTVVPQDNGTVGESPPLMTVSSRRGPTVPPQRDNIARYLELYGMSWFISASEVVDGDKFQSQQKRTYSERKQAILAHCWDTYLAFQGRLPLGLEDVPDTESLVNAGLLYAFVALGAINCAYWARQQCMPSQEHYEGAHAFGMIALGVLRQIVTEARSGQYPTASVESKLWLTFSLWVVYAVVATDKLAWEALHLIRELVKLHDRESMYAIVVHCEQNAETAGCVVEIISAAVADMLQSLHRGTDTQMGYADTFEWMNSHPITERVLPEGFGISPQMGKLALQAIAVLYGRYATKGVSPALRELHHTLSTDALVTIYSSPQSPRVQVGDMLMRQVLFCLIYLDGFGFGPDDPNVQRASETILELFNEALSCGIFTARWLLPIIVGGSLCTKDRRENVLNIYETMEATCGADDLAVGRYVTKQVWKRRDAGREDWSWRAVFKDKPESDVVFI